MSPAKQISFLMSHSPSLKGTDCQGALPNETMLFTECQRTSNTKTFIPGTWWCGLGKISRWNHLLLIHFYDNIYWDLIKNNILRPFSYVIFGHDIYSQQKTRTMNFGQSPSSTKLGYFLSSHATVGNWPPARPVTVREITASTSQESRLIGNVEEEFTLSARTV